MVGTISKLHMPKPERTDEDLERARLALSPAGGPRRHVVVVPVEEVDLAVVEALHYAQLLRADETRAVHFMTDPAGAARLERAWPHLSAARCPLEVLECPDRRLGRAAATYVSELASAPGSLVNVVVPRRLGRGLWARILHDQTGARLARRLAHLDNVIVTVVPVDVDRLLALRRHPAAVSKGPVMQPDLRAA
ncbi:MAG: hypothetical protein ACYCTI_00165 [Acidimicrobiales bacterium]